MNKLILTLLSLTTCAAVSAQDTLPKFSVRNVGNKRIIIDWVNNFDLVKQISIQRSFDSLKNFKTVLTVPDPSIAQNGYVDTRAENDHMYYRLYILLDKGSFLFSSSKRPVWDTAVADVKRMNGRPDNRSPSVPAIQADSLSVGPLVTDNRPKAEAWMPSKFVYTFRDGYIRINLPEDENKYSIKFFTMEDQLLFELKDLKEKNFKLDKANFYRSGWFKFELYENGELKEKNKFFLPKEF